jgi:hypothetical protein
MNLLTPSTPHPNRQGAGAIRALARGAAVLAGVAGLLYGLPSWSANAAEARAARVIVSQLKASGSKITVAGRVQLPVDSAKERRRSRVTITLTATRGTPERWVLGVDSHERFKAIRSTQLSGAVAVAVSIKVAGKTLGKRLVRTIAVPVSPGTGQSGSPTGAGGTPTTGTGSGTGTETGAGTTPGSGEELLKGTFEIEAATNTDGTVPAGSWFEMFDPPTWTTPLPNSNSTLPNHDYTPLPPGTDGGLETFAYEPAPNPAFVENKTSKGLDAVANDIMQPQNFFGVNFSVVTEATDPQTKEADPLPAIVDEDGQLSGQITAWTVGWNNQWFNQGSPKPNGTVPAGSTALSGTYNAATGRYVLEWKSLIVGGPFGTYAGLWHLEGTFVPAG